LARCGVDENRITAALIDSVYPGHKSGDLINLVADADGVGIGTNTCIANIDIVIARGEVGTS
jgi:hypothetical protein